MTTRGELRPFNYHGFHKGFYNDEDTRKSLEDIEYANFFEYPHDDEFPYDSALQLLYGSCHHFALSLHKTLNYNPYIIEGKNKKGFHAFCQISLNKKCYYVDARGITSSFDEFMDVASKFVSDEYTIRPILSDDIKEWEAGFGYNNEAYEFAESVIKKFVECYTL